MHDVVLQLFLIMLTTKLTVTTVTTMTPMLVVLVGLQLLSQWRRLTNTMTTTDHRTSSFLGQVDYTVSLFMIYTVGG